MVVQFIVKATGETVTKIFESYYIGQKFVNKLRFSKKLILVAYGRL